MLETPSWNPLLCTFDEEFRGLISSFKFNSSRSGYMNYQINPS